MKASELKQLIKEEILKIVSESTENLQLKSDSRKIYSYFKKNNFNTFLFTKKSENISDKKDRRTKSDPGKGVEQWAKSKFSPLKLKKINPTTKIEKIVEKYPWATADIYVADAPKIKIPGEEKPTKPSSYGTMSIVVNQWGLNPKGLFPSSKEIVNHIETNFPNYDYKIDSEKIKYSKKIDTPIMNDDFKDDHYYNLLINMKPKI